MIWVKVFLMGVIYNDINQKNMDSIILAHFLSGC